MLRCQVVTDLHQEVRYHRLLAIVVVDAQNHVVELMTMAAVVAVSARNCFRHQTILPVVALLPVVVVRTHFGILRVVLLVVHLRSWIWHEVLLVIWNVRCRKNLRLKYQHPPDVSWYRSVVSIHRHYQSLRQAVTLIVTNFCPRSV